MATIRIPASQDAVFEALDGVGDLIKAKEWERAALVASIVRLGAGQGTSSRTGRGDRMSAREFAELGIVGLSSTSTVSAYVQRWLDANDGEYPGLGKRVELPEVDWPPTSLDDPRHTGVSDREAIMAEALAAGTGTTKALDIAKNKPAMAAAIAGSPAVARAAAAALPREIREEVYRSVVDERVSAADRLPGGRSIPSAVASEARERGYDQWEQTRETKMRDALARGLAALREMSALEAEGDLSTDELELVRALRDAATEFVTLGMEAAL